MDRITVLENRLNVLEKAFIQAQKNSIPVTQKADTTVTLAQNIESITPYTETKTAYIDDTSITFTEVPEGNMLIFCPMDYTAERHGNTVLITFEPLAEIIDITIMIQ